MKREQILACIEEVTREYDWPIEDAMEKLREFGFEIEKVIDNNKFDKPKVQMMVDFVYAAR